MGRRTQPIFPAPIDDTARHDASAGFTLIEVVIVIVIMAVAAAIVVPNLRAGARQREVRLALQRFVSAVRQASAQAVVGRQRVELKLWPDEGAYAIVSRARSQELPEDEQSSLLASVGSRHEEVEREVETTRFKLPGVGSFGDVEGGRSVVEDGTIVFDFYPAGSSSGGTVEFVFDGDRNRRQAYLLEINPLVSSMSIEEVK